MSNVSLVDGHIDEPKMTDEEIVRLLNHIVHIYAKDITATINGIPLIGFLDDILDLINRKDAEIERLKKILENRGEICKLCEGKYTEKIKRAKAKAIKEFAEIFKAKSYLNDGVVYIDNLVKEMVGD